jgi:hypothetical protein
LLFGKFTSYLLLELSSTGQETHLLLVSPRPAGKIQMLLEKREQKTREKTKNTSLVDQLAAAGADLSPTRCSAR